MKQYQFFRYFSIDCVNLSIHTRFYSNYDKKQPQPANEITVSKNVSKLGKYIKSYNTVYVVQKRVVYHSIRKEAIRQFLITWHGFYRNKCTCSCHTDYSQMSRNKGDDGSLQIWVSELLYLHNYVRIIDHTIVSILQHVTVVLLLYLLELNVHESLWFH